MTCSSEDLDVFKSLPERCTPVNRLRARRIQGASGLAAFSLIELLVILLVVSLLAALSVGALRASRGSARDARSLVNASQIAASVAMYCDESGGLVPAFFPPIFARYPGSEPFRVSIRGVEATGFWFDHPLKYHYALRPLLPSQTLSAPGPRTTNLVTLDTDTTEQIADYHLARCFYASPEYWSERSQRGDSQWRAQRLYDVTFPSLKGFIHQSVRRDPGAPPRGQTITTWPDRSDAVAWSDLSATITFQRDLLPGVADLFDHYNSPAAAAGGTPAPIAQTRDGIRGRDR